MKADKVRKCIEAARKGNNTVFNFKFGQVSRELDKIEMLSDIGQQILSSIDYSDGYDYTVETRYKMIDGVVTVIDSKVLDQEEIGICCINLK